MARANFVKKAQKTIYQQGKVVSYVSKKGKREGQTLSKRDRTIPYDENDPITIVKGESYYWWEFMNGGLHISKTQPRQSQLTQSEYLSSVYEFGERIGDVSFTEVGDLESFVEDLKSDVENLKSETEDRLSNMPDSLQESPNGQLLQERIDALDNALSELENIDCEFEEGEEGETEEEKEERLSTHLQEKLEELQQVSFE